MLLNGDLIPHLSLTNASALPGEKLTPKIVPYQSYHILKHHSFGLPYLRQLSTKFSNFSYVIAMELELLQAYLISPVCLLLFP